MPHYIEHLFEAVEEQLLNSLKTNVQQFAAITTAGVIAAVKAIFK